MSVRRTVYMSAEEDDALRKLAEQEGSSINYLVRCGIRVVIGLPVPRWLRAQLREEVDRAEGS